MAVVSDLVIAHAALAGGFPRDKIATAVAVALAESGGDATATNHNFNGSTDYGIWQINSIHKDILASGDWKDPNTNGRMAAAVFKNNASSFKPWTAYRIGTYQAFTSRGDTAAKEALGGKQPDPGNNPLVPDIIEKPFDATQELGKLARTLGDRDLWVRIGLAALGAVLAIAAIGAIFWAMGGQKVAKAAVSIVVPGGKGKEAADDAGEDKSDE